MSSCKRVLVRLNGRFLAAKRTGVQRVALELLLSLDNALARSKGDRDRFDWVLIVPEGATFVPELRNIRLQEERCTLLPRGVCKLLKEHLRFPSIGRRSMNLNLANVGGVFSRNSITMIHDAQVYIVPASYSGLFRFYYKCMYAIIGKIHRRILTVSEYSKTQLIRFRVAKSEKIKVIYNGVDHFRDGQTNNKISIERFGLNIPYFLAPSSVQYHKNIRVLLDAFSRDRLSCFELVLYGAGTKSDFLEANLKVSKNIRFVGRVSDPELEALIRNAEGFCFPSLTEGFGLPPLEAMFLGCPVITSPSGAIPEVCGDAVTYADPENTNDWVDKIGLIGFDKDYSDKKRQAGHVRAQQFTWAEAGNKLLDVVRSEVFSG